MAVFFVWKGWGILVPFQGFGVLLLCQGIVDGLFWIPYQHWAWIIVVFGLWMSLTP